MIAFKGGAQDRNGRRRGVIPRFDAAVHYLHHGSYKVPRVLGESHRTSRVAWVTTRNVPTQDPWCAVVAMEQTAKLNGRVKEPGYHMGASLPPGETLDRAQWEEVADAMLARLGLGEHQAVIALHEDRGHQHVHVIANRVHEQGHAWKPSFDERKLTQVMREMERRFGLRRVPTRSALAHDPDEPPPGPPALPWSKDLAAARIRRVLLADLRPVQTWDELDDLLAKNGLRLVAAKRGAGAVVLDGGKPVNLSKVDRVLSGVQLGRRFAEPLRAYLARRTDRPPLVPQTASIELADAALESERIVGELSDRLATWTERDVRIAAAHRPDLDLILDLVAHHAQVQRIAIDSNGDLRFTTHDYAADELMLFEAAEALADRSRLVSDPRAVARIHGVSDGGLDVLEEILTGSDLALVVGQTRSGKTSLAGQLALTYRGLGHAVIGLAPSARGAAVLGEAGRIDARTLASWRFAWRSGRTEVHAGTVVIVDDAGQLATRDLGSLLARVDRAGGKAILLGDPDGLQPLGPGAAFRGLVERYRATELSQGEPRHNVSLDRVTWSADRDQAVARLAERLVARIETDGDVQPLAITATRAEAAQVNEAVLDLRRERAQDKAVAPPTIAVRNHEISVGDRVRFLRSDRRGRHVRSIHPHGDATLTAGDLGTVRGIDGGMLEIARDRGGTVRIDPTTYDHLDHAFAVHVHQATAREVDHAFVLLGRHMDRHMASVALTRHGTRLEVFADRQTFPSNLDLERVIHRDRRQGLIQDHGELALGDTSMEKAADLVRKLEAHRATWQASAIEKLGRGNRHLADLAREVPDAVVLPNGRFTTKRYLEAELDLARVAETLTADAVEPVDVRQVDRIAAKHHLSHEQTKALEHAASKRLGLIAGRAGSGKTRLVRALTDHARDHGLRVRGAALAGKAADVLASISTDHEAGIETQTLAAWTTQWQRAEQHLSAKDILVVDEASMVDVPTLAQVAAEVERAGARLVLIGDPDQLRPIGPGDAFRLLLERHPSATLDDVRRQRQPWQAEASRAAATGRIGKAIEAYHDQGAIHPFPNQRAAAQALVTRYLDREQGRFDQSLVVAYRRKDVRALNHAIHEARMRSGELSGGIRFRGREFSVGDRIILGANDPEQNRVPVIEGRDGSVGQGAARQGGVRNGALGSVQAIEGKTLHVRLDDGRLVAIDPARYHRFDHGYATTIHKAQGMTVDRAYVLPSRAMDRAAAYVALTRHRDSLEVFVSRGSFPTRDHLVEALSDKGTKQLVLDVVDAETAEQLLRDREAGHQQKKRGREPVVRDPRMRQRVIRTAIDQLEKHGQAEQLEERLNRRLAHRSDQMRRVGIERARNALTSQLDRVFKRPDVARSRLLLFERAHGLGAASDALERRPEQFGTLVRSWRGPSTHDEAARIAERMRAVETSTARVPEDPRSLQLRARIDRVRRAAQRLALPDELRFEIGLVASAMRKAEIERLPASIRPLVTELRREHRKHVKAMAKAPLAKLVGRSDRKPEHVRKVLKPLLRTATRQGIYRLSPKALRPLIRAATLARVPSSLLLHMAPPAVRIAILAAQVARSMARGLSRGR